MTTPTYTPMARADFAAVGIELRQCNQCWARPFKPIGCADCNHGYTGPDITGVLCNREPATDEEGCVNAALWLHENRGDCTCTILHVRPEEPLRCLEAILGRSVVDHVTGCTSTPKMHPGDGYHPVCPTHPIHDIHGLLITGGDTPLNPDYVSSLIEQADAAGVPVWLDWGNAIPNRVMFFNTPREDQMQSNSEWFQNRINGKDYRNLPTSMMGGK